MAALIAEELADKLDSPGYRIHWPNLADQSVDVQLRAQALVRLAEGVKGATPEMLELVGLPLAAMPEPEPEPSATPAPGTRMHGFLSDRVERGAGVVVGLRCVRVLMDLQPFQRRFIKRALAPGMDTAALTLPRGNGKSWLAAYIAAKELQRISRHEEIALCAASIEQGRIVFRFIRQMLGEDGWRYLDSATRCAITRSDGARLRVIGSNGRTAMGLVDTPLVIADEPGAWEVNGGQLMADALFEAQGKPGSPLRLIIIGTLAPAESGWWHELIDGGTQGTTYVQALKGNPEKWDTWREVMRVNPLAKSVAGTAGKVEGTPRAGAGRHSPKGKIPELPPELPYRRRNADALGSCRLSADA